MKIIKDRFEYIRQSLSLPLFYQAGWWDANCGENDWTPAVIVDHNGEIVAVWPFKLTRKLGLNLLQLKMKKKEQKRLEKEEYSQNCPK
jgi:hypothetical protein